MHILFGEDDDYTPLSLCKKLIDYMKPARDVELTVYPNAHHSFDSIDPVEFIPYAIKPVSYTHLTLPTILLV